MWLLESAAPPAHSNKMSGRPVGRAPTTDCVVWLALVVRHTVPALWNPEYEKMQQNAVRWLLRET